MYREKIEAYFADKQDQILADIDRLIRIKSEREEAQRVPEEAPKPEKLTVRSAEEFEF